MNTDNFKIIDIYPGTDETVTAEERLAYATQIINELMEQINNGNFDNIDIVDID